MNRSAESRQLYLVIGSAYARQKKVEELFPDSKNKDSVRVYHGWEFDPAKFIEEAQTYPFLASRQLLLLKEADRLQKAAKESLKKALGVIPPFTAIVLETEDMSKDDLLYAWAEESGAVCRLSEVKGQPEQFVRQFLKKEGKSMAPEVMEMLIKNSGGDEGLLAEGLDKLALYAKDKKEIGRAEVGLLSEHGGDLDNFALVNAFSRNQTGKVIGIVGELFAEKNEAGPEILGGLNWHFKRLWRVHELLDAGRTPYEIAKELRMPSQFVNDLISHAKRFSRERLSQVFEGLFELDVQIKRGMINPRAGIESFLIRFSGVRLLIF